MQLGILGLVDETHGPIGISQDGCSLHLLEPNQHCTMAVSFKPVRGGSVTAMPQLPSSNGVLSVAVTAVARRFRA